MAWANRTSTTPSDPLDEAARWRARLSADDATSRDEAGFRAWVSASPANGAAWRATETAWDLWDAAADDPRVAALRRRSTPRRATRRWIPAAIAAGLALTVAAGLGVRDIAPPSPFKTPPVVAARYATALGEVRRVTLQDGTVMTLDAQSAVRVAFDGRTRDVALDAGRARFQVAHDKAHPFVVSAHGRSVTALGTVFDVELAPAGVTVTLVEGRVAVRGPEHETVLAPGQRLTAPDRGGWTRQVVEADEAAGWTTGRLVFDGRALGDVAAEMNRYSARKLVIADAALAATPISGVFRPGDVTTLAAGLETSRTARVAQRTPSEIVLGRP
jgi:transmembrane sensor